MSGLNVVENASNGCVITTCLDCCFCCKGQPPDKDAFLCCRRAKGSYFTFPALLIAKGQTVRHSDWFIDIGINSEKGTVSGLKEWPKIPDECPLLKEDKCKS
jgi:hypothetical protein